MTKSCGLFVLLLLCLSPAVALAQESAPTPQDQSAAPPETAQKSKARETPKYEISAGYAYRSYYQPGSNLWLNGWYASADYNLTSWLGAEAEGMGVYKNQGLILGKTRIYDFMVGPKFYPLRHRKLTPFGHFLFGAARYSNTVPPIPPYGSATKTATTRGWEAGGGLDLNLSQHWGVRLIQADFGSSNFFGGSNVNQGSHRIMVGIVYRFGER